MTPEELLTALESAPLDEVPELLATHLKSDHAPAVVEHLLARIGADPLPRPHQLIPLSLLIGSLAPRAVEPGIHALIHRATAALDRAPLFLRRQVVAMFNMATATFLSDERSVPPHVATVMGEQAVTLARSLVAEDDTQRVHLAAALFAYGRALAASDRDEEALAPLRESVALGRALAAGDSSYEAAVSEPLFWLATVFGALGRESEMVRAFEEAERFGQPDVFLLTGELPPWHLLFRLYLGCEDEPYLERARQAAATDAEIAALLDAYREDDLESVVQQVQALMPRLRDAGRLAEYLTAQLLLVSLPVQHLRYLEEYEASQYGRILDLQIKACDRAITISRELQDTPCLAKYRFFRAAVQQHRHALYLQDSAGTAEQDLEEAVTLYRELVEWDPGFRAPLMNALSNLALLRQGTDRPGGDEALEEATAICRELARDDPVYRRPLARLLNNLAYVQGHRNDFAEAIALLAEARRLCNDAPADDRVFQEESLTILTNLGATLFVQDQDDEALACTGEALTVYRTLAAGRPVYRPLVATNLLTLRGHLLAHGNQLAAAHDAFAEAIELVEGYLIALPDSVSQERFLGRELNPYEAMIDTCLRLADSAAGGERQQWEQEAWAYAERSRARLTAEFIQRVALAGDGVHDSDERRAVLAALARKRQELLSLHEAAQQTAVQATEDLPPALRAWLIERFMSQFSDEVITAQLDELRQRLEGLDPALAALTRVTVPDLDAVQGRLREVPDGALLLELYPLEDRLVVFVLDGKRLAVAPVALSRAELSEHTGRFRRYLENPLGFDLRTEGVGFVQELDRELRWLGERLQPVITQYLPGEVRDDAHAPHLLLVPAGPLHHWPLWALPIRPDGERLGDRYACAVLPSADTLISLAEYAPHPDAAIPLTGFAPPDPALRFNLPLACHAATVFSGRAYVGAEATFEALRQVAGGVVVLSTHAKVQLDTPELSWVQLASAGGERDGVSALEFLFGLDRLRSPLVTVLACEVHGALPVASDNWVGLSRAFLRVGRSLVTSLWALDDAATLALTVPLWDALRAGLTIPQALRVATRDLRTADLATAQGWGDRVATALPEAARTAFQEVWAAQLAPGDAIPVAPFASLAIWAPYLAIGWPGPLPPGRSRTGSEHP